MAATAPNNPTPIYDEMIAKVRSRLAERRAGARAKLQFSKDKATKTPPPTAVDASPVSRRRRRRHNMSCRPFSQEIEKAAAHAAKSARPTARSVSPAKRKTDDGEEVSRAKRSKSDPMEYQPDTVVNEPVPTQAAVHSDEDVTKQQSESDLMDHTSDAAAESLVFHHTGGSARSSVSSGSYHSGGLSARSSVSSGSHHSAMQSDEDVTENPDKLSSASSVHNDAGKDEATENLELRILQMTQDNINGLRHEREKAEKRGAELSRCVETMGRLMEQYLARTKAKYRLQHGGSDTPEQPQIKILTPRSKEIAKELVRRLKSECGYDEIVDPFLETEHTPNLFYLMQIREGVKDLPYNIAPAIWFLLPTLRVERENAYHALVAHPYITRKTASSPKDMESQLKQSVIDFFDKSFTYQVGAVYGLQVSLQGPLLSLGGDAVFKSSDGLNNGGENFRGLNDYNQQVWHDLVLRSEELPPQINKHNSSKRARTESSVSSLGLTGLFLNEKEDAEYEGDDEAIPEKQIRFAGHQDYRNDSGIEFEYFPFHTSMMGNKVQPHVMSVEVEEHSKASDGVPTSSVQKNDTDGDQEVMGVRRLYNLGDHIKLVSAKMYGSDVFRGS